MNKGLLFGLCCLLLVGFVSANELQVDLNTPLIIKASCSGVDASANIMIYSGSSNIIPENLVTERTDMIRLSPSDFVFTKSFDSTGVFTAFEECVYGGGFTTEQTTTITVTELQNLLTLTSLKDYKYEADLYYNAYFKLDPTKDKTVKFDLGSDVITFQPKELNIINGVDTKKQTIKTPQHGFTTVDNNVLSYNNVYGSGLSLQYLINTKYVKEDLKIDNASVLPVAHSDLVDPMLELNFLMTTSTNHIFIDGVEWNRDVVHKISTSNKVVIKNDFGDTIYVMEVPVAFDSNGAYVTGSYTFEKDSANNKVSVTMPYSWFKDSARVFPIMVDPTVDTPDGTNYFGSSTPIIVVGNLTVPAGVPYIINQTILLGNVPIMDAECELNIIDDSTGFKVVDFRSFFNNWDGYYFYTWDYPVVGNFTLDEYCWLGNTLVLNKIYSVSSIVVV